MAENNPQPPATNGARPRPPPGRRPNTGNPLRPMRRGPRPPPRPGQPKPAAAAPAQKTEQDIAERRKQNGGWLDPPPPGCSDIPIMTTKKALLDGIRHHMLKFASKPGQVVDPTDQDEFARPVTLHRRDPRQPPPGRAVKEEPIPEPEPKSVDQEEQDRLAQIKADKEAQRAIDQAKIAPVIKDNQPKKPKKAKEDKITFNRAPKTEAAKKESEIRYEEALPWHLEDADGKNVWVGSYVSALSETTVALTIDGGVFRMVPIEKWYRMASKPPFEAYTIEMVENIMGKKTLESRWAKRDQERKEAEGDMEFTRRMFYGKGPMIKTESDTFKAASRSEKLDHDDLDVSGDEFQDDDEQPTLERQDDEDTKETNERIKREQREANNFGEGDEQELEKELKAQLKEQLDRQKYGKKLKKKLLKNQDNVYDESESDEKPWTSSSESESDEEEEEEEKKEGENGVNEKDNTASQNSADRDKEKTSGSSTKGTNTPKKLNTKSLKRAGSPSESSGNESVRKKVKTKKTAVGASGASASARGSRAGTPVSAGAQRRHLGAGSGSDGEATAGEMSDGAGGVKKNKIKLVGSNRGTPNVSRQGSPAPVAGGASPPPSAPTVTAKEILDVLPEDGLNIRDLMAAFKSRIGSGPGQIDRAEFVGMVKNVCAYGQDKKLRRRAAGTAKSPSA